MEYILILCLNDTERRVDINQLIEDFNELIYRKYPDCVILKGDIKVRFFTDLECKLGKTTGYNPYCTLYYYDKNKLVTKILEIYERKLRGEK